MTLDNPVLSALLPVGLLIGIGFVAGKAKLIRGEGVRDLSNLVFLVLAQALLFRTMSSVHIERLNFGSVALYYAVAIALFLIVLALQGWHSRSAVIALGAIFSNMLMIGVPLVGLAYGEAGLVQLFALVSMHALVVLTFATVVLELLVAHEQSQAGQGERRHLLLIVGTAMKNAIVHPIPLPIIAGLLYAQTGWGLPAEIDRPLKLLGDAFGPVALVLVGVTLAHTAIGMQLKGALVISAIKTFVHPVLMLAAGWLFGLRGVQLAVMVMAAALPVGANVFLFAHRYRKAEDLVTATLAVSTAMALVSVSLVLALVPKLPP
ncbi:MAG: AEC family transporter [Burkholderiaceae bacterium]|nr:AEC family transporter [Burkholderiaceae bacterium]